MAKTEKIIRHLPNFYAAYDRKSLLFKLIDEFGMQLQDIENALVAVIKSHAIRFADLNKIKVDDLSKLAALFAIKPEENEEAEQFRQRLRSLIRLYLHGLGTAEAVIRMVALNFYLQIHGEIVPPVSSNPLEDEYYITRAELQNKDGKTIQVAVIDNPAKDNSFVRKIRLEESWEIHNKGVISTTPIIKITGIKNRTVSPVITNVSTGQAIGYSGAIPEGKTLFVFTSESGTHAHLEGKDVSENLKAISGNPVEAEIPDLPTGRSIWSYTCSLARFNSADFDEAAFAHSIPIGKYDTSMFEQSIFAFEPLAMIEFLWQEREPATFRLRVPWNILDVSGLKITGAKFGQSCFNDTYFVQDPRSLLPKVIDEVKAAGIKCIVDYYYQVPEERQTQDDTLSLFRHNITQQEVALQTEELPGLASNITEQEAQTQQDAIILSQRINMEDPQLLADSFKFTQGVRLQEIGKQKEELKRLDSKMGLEESQAAPVDNFVFRGVFNLTRFGSSKLN